MKPLRHGSLFTGIGGFDLAAHWMGWQNVFQVENDKACLKVLNKNFPNTTKFQDIKDFSGHEYTNKIDIISGGFPCQPFSVAGERKGKTDHRHLWPEMFRVIQTIKPLYVVGENVPGIVGVVLDEVLDDLESQGYATESFIIPACSKNAWHRRDRVWVIAYPYHYGKIGGTSGNEEKSRTKGIQERDQVEHVSFSDNIRESFVLADTISIRGNQSQQNSQSELIDSNGSKRGIITDTNDGRGQGPNQEQEISANENWNEPNRESWWEAEPGLDRMAHGIPGRLDRLKQLGNAVVPQIPFSLYQKIQKLHNQYYHQKL